EMSLLRRTRCFLAASLVLAGTGLAASSAHAGDLDLEDDDAKPAKDDTTPKKGEPILPPAPIATIKPHAYTLAECLALTERNHPYLWAFRARLAFVHAQLDEARWTPYSYWGASVTTGVLPTIGGTPFYNQVPRSALSQGFGAD